MVEPDRDSRTPARLRHPALDPMASFASAFGPEALKRVEEDLHHFFSVDDFSHLQERLEFSLALGDSAQSDLRYGLFRLFEPDRIEAYFRNHGYPHVETRRIVDLMGPVTPEFAVGNDFSRDRERMKLYCMRLDSLKDRMGEVAGTVERLSQELKIPVDLPPGVHLDDITLLGIDFHPHMDRRDLKIYTVLPVDGSRAVKMPEPLSAKGIYLQRVSALMENDAGHEPGSFIQCFRFTNTKPGPIGYALFHHIRQGLWPHIKTAVNEISPEGHAWLQQLFERVRSRGWEVAVGNIGASLSLPDGKERFHVYFSVI